MGLLSATDVVNIGTDFALRSIERGVYEAGNLAEHNTRPLIITVPGSPFYIPTRSTSMII